VVATWVSPPYLDLGAQRMLGLRFSVAMAAVRIGISGWTYPPWRGVFYPRRWPQKRELEYASRQVNSIEINGSFYSLQRPTSYDAWRKATPDRFVFSVKAPRFITHLKRLKNVKTPLANFFASGVLCLREKLGPILWQLPPSFRFDSGKLASFFELLPRTTREAAHLARRHDDKVEGRVWAKTDCNRPLRHAMEIRHESFVTTEFVELLRKHDVALVIADTAGKWPFLEDITSDFVYVRLHGDSELYVSGYTDTALDTWARKIRTWANGGTSQGSRRISKDSPRTKSTRDVYVYFDNDVKVRAPFDAMSLAHRLNLGPPPEAPAELEKVVETARLNWPVIRRRWESSLLVKS
jgi:uncharacterized protein YecE (DUF72 family)